MLTNAVLNISDISNSKRQDIESYLGGEIQWVDMENLYQIDTNKLHLFIPNDTLYMAVRERLRQWSLIESKYCLDNTFQHYTLEYTHNPFDNVYLELLKELRHAPARQSRNSNVRSLFCRHLTFDLSIGFPLLTTKRMFWKGVLEEFLFFVRGETDTRLLEQKGIRIWSDNTSRPFLDQNGLSRRMEKHLGPMYGYQWRHYNAEYNEQTGKPNEQGKDQLVELIHQIRQDPYSRRHLMTDYNPCQVKQGVLYPCHSLILQFYVENNYLNMFCYNRSSDVFLGLPFNIASSALMLSLVAHLTGLKPHRLHLSLGDCHLYEDHEKAVECQLNPSRIPWKPPQLQLHIESNENPELILANLRSEQFVLEGYRCHRAISAPMIP